MEAKFFGLFCVLHLVGKQVYKLELSRKWKIHDVFYVSLLEQDITRKGQVDENATELDAGEDDSGEYEVEAIWNSAIYAKKSELGHLPGLYYLVSWKDYPKEENTWEPASAVQHLKKLIRSFHKDHPDKLTATSAAINIAPPMARTTAKLSKPTKQKQSQTTNSSNKQAKKTWAAFDFYRVFGISVVRIIHASNFFSLVITWLSLDSLKILSFKFYLPSLSYKASVFLLSCPLG